MSEHTIELELLKPGPRKIRKKLKTVATYGCVQVFLIPHMLVGLFLPCYLLTVLCIALFGVQSPGTVTALRDYWTTGKSPHHNFEVKFRYAPAGVERTRTNNVPDVVYDTLDEGSPVTVQYLAQFPDVHPVLVGPGYQPFREIPLFVLFTVVWDTAMGFVGWSLYIRPVLNKRLVESGEAATGRVTDKKLVAGRGTTYTLSYDFEPQQIAFARPPIVSSRMPVTSMDYDRVAIGEEYTVLYDPKHPKINLLYRFADYEVVS